MHVPPSRKLSGSELHPRRCSSSTGHSATPVTRSAVPRSKRLSTKCCTTKPIRHLASPCVSSYRATSTPRRLCWFFKAPRARAKHGWYAASASWLAPTAFPPAGYQMEHEAGVEPACFGFKAQRGCRQPTARVWFTRYESNVRVRSSELRWDASNPHVN